MTEPVSAPAPRPSFPWPLLVIFVVNAVFWLLAEIRAQDWKEIAATQRETIRIQRATIEAQSKIIGEASAAIEKYLSHK